MAYLQAPVVAICTTGVHYIYTNNKYDKKYVDWRIWHEQAINANGYIFSGITSLWLCNNLVVQVSVY
ncbi:hypothetical protein BGI33_11345 [Snodgrassella alvi]|uniref:Uncharacterized protein n=1 Tax=Snodgrassella alvi TaxID=1196083 RepID=A0A2N9WSW0_9NEIS|nr:hypothetical protein BGI33_11345 [Snodgrassella alvi]PIT14268.1 hypothetical protein BGI32_08090 [Snodgrassella alvi]PIT18769.1 hypothetical protein BGI34_04320 [Snodgrassella alvi]